MGQSDCDIVFTGETLLLDRMGGLYWPARETLVISDLHFEKGSSFADRGVMLPPYDTKTTLSRIAALISRYKPACIVSLGDAFHDRGAETRMAPDDVEQLQSITQSVRWIWILGNHDPTPPACFAGEAMDIAEFEPITFCHEPTEYRRGAASSRHGEISGHLHPSARILTEGRVLRRRCFVVGEQRLVMPALGAYTGGLNVRDEAYRGLWGTNGVFSTYCMGDSGVYRVPQQALTSERKRIDREAS